MGKSNNLVLELYKRPESVFTFKDIGVMFPDFSRSTLKNKLHYATKTGKIISLRKGIYAKEGFNPYEAANKIYTPSYISLETVLAKSGVTFQYYESIFAISYISRTVKVGNHTIAYRRMKKDILLNKQGIEEQENVIIASPERAFLDAVYLYKDYHFDNLSALDWNKITELKNLYSKRKFLKRVEEYFQLYKEDHT